MSFVFAPLRPMVCLRYTLLSNRIENYLPYKYLSMTGMPMPKVFDEAGFTGRFYISIRAFAQTLHQRGEAWSGMFEGWPATYTPEDRTRRPANSRMTFIPAEFFVGKSEVWHVAIAWEDGRDAPPVELENRRGVSGKSRVAYLDEYIMDANPVLMPKR